MEIQVIFAGRHHLLKTATYQHLIIINNTWLQVTAVSWMAGFDL